MIWILLPAYNEEDSLPNLLPKIKEIFKEKNIDFRLVIVNDGSTDGTAKIISEYSIALPIITITHPINRGLGETERDGYEYIVSRCSDDDYIIRLEGDDTHHPSYMFELIQKLNEGFDVVNTSRFQRGGGQKGLNSYRTTLSYAANLFMKVIFNINGVKDHSCGYRAYKGKVLKDAISIFGDSFLQLRGLGFTSTLEIIVKLNLLGVKFTEVPFVLRYDLKQSSSKMVGSITTLGYFSMAIMYHWPWGGWKSQYKEVKKMYLKDRGEALRKFKKYELANFVSNKPLL